MTEYIYKERTERNLPHLHPPDTTLFVTFRLAETIPKSLLRLYHAQKQRWKEETECIIKQMMKDDSPELAAHEQRFLEFRRQWFVEFEDILHKEETGPTWLKDEQVARIVAEVRYTAWTLIALCLTTFTQSLPPFCRR